MHRIDPPCLPQTRGVVTQFLLNPHGEPDGFILGKERQVHFPPRMSKLVVKHIHIGDKVSVRGIKPRGAHVIAAIELKTGSGAVLLDEGPPHCHQKHGRTDSEKKPMSVSGQVRLSLYGPKGELRGALLVDGSIHPDAATCGHRPRELPSARRSHLGVGSWHKEQASMAKRSRLMKSPN